MPKLYPGEGTSRFGHENAAPAFSRAARSAELIPAISDFILHAGPIDNRWFMAAMILAWIGVAMTSRTIQEAAAWEFFATYVLSPMRHTWNFFWVLPFAVESRNRGIIALVASGIA